MGAILWPKSSVEDGGSANLFNRGILNLTVKKTVNFSPTNRILPKFREFAFGISEKE
jgi:hypothetical protein